MKLKIYSIQDIKAGNFNNPLFAVNDLCACRSISNALADPATSLALDPADFILFCIGEFDSQSGVITPLDVPKLISPVVNLKKEGV